MAKFSIPYLKLRNGHPRWEPGPALRNAGWKGQDLKHEDGTWMALDDAIITAQGINSDVKTWRANGKKRRAKPAPISHAHSVQKFFERWYKSADFMRLKPATRDDYEMKAAIFLEVFGEHHVQAITKPHLIKFWENMYAERGHHMANGIKAVVSSALSYAELIGWRPENSNPARNMKRPQPAARIVLWLPGELETFMRISTEIEYYSVGDALITALHSGQRLSDVLAMPVRIFDDRIRLTQFKRGALIDAPMTPMLKARVDEIRDRHKRAARIPETLIINERTGRPHTKNSLNKHFCHVRKLCAAELPDIMEKRFQDLRDTAVTRLALADCNMAEISSITGHSLPTITQVMKHYLALQPEMADSAITKLNIWMDREGIAI